MTIKDARYREAQQKLVWTETKCKEMNALAQEDHTYMARRARTIQINVELHNK